MAANSPESSLKIKQLYGGTPQGFAGQLVKESQFQWRYESQEAACGLSLGMPVRFGSYACNTVHPIFAMNLPEGEQYHRIRTRLAKQFAKLDEMALLSIVGHDQIGRVRLTQAKAEQAYKGAMFGLRQIKTLKASDELFDHLFEQYFAVGISGVQPKFMIPDADSPAPLGRATARVSELIIKTGGHDYPFLSQNEFVCMLAAKKADIAVPEFHLSNDGGMFIMRRFDVVHKGAGQEPDRLGFEDFAALTNATYDIAGDYKYRGNYEGIAKLIGQQCLSDAVQQKYRFFEQLALSVMVRNGDAHLKNFGLLYSEPSDKASIRLSPLFDVVTTAAYDHESSSSGRMVADRTLALKLNKTKNYPTRQEMLDFGRSHCGVRHPEQVIERIAQAMGEVQQEFSHLFPYEFATRMSCEWDAGRMSLQPDQMVATLKSGAV
jgi:serine/threonine-protein kinase HipA